MGAILKDFREISGSFLGDFREILGRLWATLLAPKLQPKIDSKIDGFLETFGARLEGPFWSIIRLKNMVKNQLIFGVILKAKWGAKMGAKAIPTATQNLCENQFFQWFCKHFDLMGGVWQQVVFGSIFALIFGRKSRPILGPIWRPFCHQESIDFLVDFWMQFGNPFGTTLGSQKGSKKYVIF